MSPGNSAPAWRLQHPPPQLAQMFWSTQVITLIRDASLGIRTDYAGRLRNYSHDRIVSVRAGELHAHGQAGEKDYHAGDGIKA